MQVPGALCLLQEAGETALVLEIGESLLRERLPKSFKQDIVLAMALAYVDISRDAMALSPPDFIQGCEVLERALKLLQVNMIATLQSHPLPFSRGPFKLSFLFLAQISKKWFT